MCSPALSFIINAKKKIFHKLGMQSHSSLISHFGLDESKVVKVSYDWVEKTLDIIGENEDLLPFELRYGHYKAIDDFVKETVGTEERLLKWLKGNQNDKDIINEMKKLCEPVKGKKFDFDFFKANWRSQNVS